MPLHGIELLLDPAADAAVRRDWQLLRDAGLSSRLDHRGTTNAPHVTASVRHWDPEAGIVTTLVDRPV